jgi:hypothetical protein
VIAMEQQVAQTIDTDLAGELNRAGNAGIAVQVTFREPTAPEELARLGLQPAFSRGPAVTFGVLSPEAIRLLAARVDVVRIARGPTASGRSGKDKSMDKIDGSLRREMEEKPDVSYSVLVSFVKPLEDEAVEAMGLIAGKPTEAVGQLTKSAILAMAKRAEVRRIRLSPAVKPM